MSDRIYQLHVVPPYASSFYDFLQEDNTGSPAYTGFVQFMHNRKYPMGEIKTDDHVSVSRLISTWIEHGLIDETVRDNKGSWKRFSIQDLLWVRIIVKLRWFGFPLNKIEVVKQFLFTNVHFKHGEFLFPYCITLVQQGAPLDLIVFPDGEAHILCEPQIVLDKEKILDCISINLNNIVKEVVPSLYLPPKYGHNINLTNNELYVWSLIRNGTYKKVEIFLHDGNVERYEATQQVDLNTRLGDLLKDNAVPFESIQVQKSDGKVVSINRTISQKVK